MSPGAPPGGAASPDSGEGGKVVLITGAAGGLGSGLVAAFAAAGWRVAAGQHRAPVGAASGNIWPVALDVTEPGRAEAVVAETLARWGRLDVLVNNAGVTVDAALPQVKDADFARVLSVNLSGAMACARAAVWPMLRQRDGHVVNIGSFSARGRPGQAAYAAAKAGLIGLTQSLAAEVGARNVRVNVVFPGVLPTPMTAGMTAEALASLLGRSVLRRAGSVEEVARFVVFLVGMTNVSGQVFQLDSRPARWT